ncbi:putative Retrotransposon protein [Hibiscus syriacus]|uniref:Retrotransposon protein n=1 Tax=Hibiscus syriacus TaxID=106335 RepID=A0A6A3CLN7_HIBSY|nr:putative Retrotransposon protein [Hibiscus syriacus]
MSRIRLRTLNLKWKPRKNLNLNQNKKLLLKYNSMIKLAQRLLVCFLGYESEDSSANEVGVDSAGLLDDDEESEDDKQILINNKLHTKHGARKNLHTPTKEEVLPDDFPSCILKCKSLFRCKLCPRIVCLNEETTRAHLNSKEGRLKTMLNSDGEIENQEIAAETDAPVDAVAKIVLSEI